MTVREILEVFDVLPPQAMSRKRYESFVREAIMEAGYYPVQAIVDSAHNCIVCGEAGRCPGWHTMDEVRGTAPIWKGRILS